MTVREALQEVYDRRGELSPKVVLEEARNNASPLHSHFTWDDSEAAELWRREEAHRLIQSVRVKYRREDTQQSVEIRQWHAVSAPSGMVYEPAQKIVDDPLLRAIVLRDMERSWRELRSRYESFSEFSEMIKRDLEAAG